MPTDGDRRADDRPRPPRARRRFLVALLAIAAVGFAARATYAKAVADEFPLLGDAQTYHLLAAQLAAGEGYHRPNDDPPGPTAEFPPLFPAVLSVADRLGVEDPSGQRLLPAAFGSVTIVLVGLLGRRIRGDAVGLVAAGGLALYPVAIQTDTAIMGESLYAALLVAAILLVYHALDARSPRRRLTLWALVGASIGFAALTRSEALLLVPLLVVPMTLRRSGPGWKARIGPLTAATLAALAVISPWLVRNWLTFDQFIPISNNSGTLLAGANCDATYQGTYRGLWRFECVQAVDTAGDTEPQAADALRRAGLRYATDHLGETPVIGVIRVARTFGLYHPTVQMQWETFEGRNERWARRGHAVYLVALALAVAGLAVLIRRRAVWWPLVAPVVLAAFTSLISYGNQRFRAGADPMLLVLAAVALVAGVDAIRRARAGDAGSGTDPSLHSASSPSRD